MTEQTLFVVPCSATKASELKTQPLLAKDAYTGQAFKMCRALLESHHLKWCVLSAWYGFIWPTTIIEWYDVKMEAVTPETDWECFDMISNRQYARLMTSERTVVLGSRLYADAASILLNRTVEAPMAGLSIGKMLGAIKAASWLPARRVK
jgi:hypothetical protein